MRCSEHTCSIHKRVIAGRWSNNRYLFSARKRRSPNTFNAFCFYCYMIFVHSVCTANWVRQGHIWANLGWADWLSSAQITRDVPLPPPFLTPNKASACCARARLRFVDSVLASSRHRAISLRLLGGRPFVDRPSHVTALVCLLYDMHSSLTSYERRMQLTRNFRSARCVCTLKRAQSKMFVKNVCRVLLQTHAHLVARKNLAKRAHISIKSLATCVG